VLTVVLPILAESGGWLMVLSTPLGMNHFKQLYDVAMAHPEEWYCERLTVHDVRRDAEGESGGPVVSDDEIDAARRDGMDEATVQQEFFCSFSGPVSGSVWGKEIEQADAQERIGRVPFDPGFRVSTAWDIGVHDDTAILCIQEVGKVIHVIEYVEGRGEGLAYYLRELEQRPYAWGEHLGPPDLAVKEFGTGKTRLEQARTLGVKFRVVPQLPVVDGIAAARGFLARCWFNEATCRVVLQHLAGYRPEFSTRLGQFGAPRHDQHRHAADALRYLAVGWKGDAQARLEALRKQYGTAPQYAKTSSGGIGPWGDPPPRRQSTYHP